MGRDHSRCKIASALLSPTAGVDLLCPVGSAHRWQMNNNNGGYVNVVVAAGVDNNGSDQVTATHLAAALPTNQGGTGTASALTGIVRGGHRFTASEISADATTSRSNSDDAPFDFGSVTSSVTFSANALQIIASAERSLNAKFNGKFFVLILP